MTEGPFRGDPGNPGEPDGEPAGGSSVSPRARSATPWIVALAVVLVAGVGGLWLGTRQRQAPVDEPETDVPTTPVDEAQHADVELTSANLYFPGANGRLYVERRDLPMATPAERARLLVAGLLLGPAQGADSGLRSPLPAGTRIETVYLLGTTALLDLRSAEPAAAPSEGPPTAAEARQRRLAYGSTQELLALYSLVNTVALGVEGVETVEILWDGRQPETFAGHVDTTRPLAADLRYVATR